MKKNKHTLYRIPKFYFITFFVLLFFLILTLVYETLTTVPLPDTANPVEFYSNQTRDDLKLIYDKQIASAKQSILIMIYGLKERKLVKMLNKKSDEGVDITVICDREASDNIHRLLNPKIKIYKPNLKGLMHLKILVVDHSQVIIGSANLTNDSLRLHGNLITAMHSEPMAAYIEDKGDQMIGDKRIRLSPTQRFLIGGQPVDLFFLPQNPTASNTIKSLIRSAKKSIRIAMYTWTRMDLAKTVVDALRRGINVEVVIDGHSSIGASQHVMTYLKENGAAVKASSGDGLLHHKLMWIDDSILVNGSTNWTKAAFTINDDCFTIFYNLSKEQNEKIQALWNVIINESK